MPRENDKMTAKEYQALPEKNGKKVFGEGVAAEKTAVKEKSDKGGNKRKNKYNAQKTMYEGILYDSKLEARVAHKIDQMKKAAGKDKVASVERQIRYSFEHNKVLICEYVCDFVITFADGRKEWWDAKGVEMREGKIKCNLMLAYYGITVKLIKE